MVTTITSTYIRLDPSETGGCKHKKHNTCYPCSLGLLCRNQMKRSWPKTWPCCKRHPEIPCYHGFVAVTLLVGWVPGGLWKSYKNADRIHHISSLMILISINQLQVLVVFCPLIRSVSNLPGVGAPIPSKPGERPSWSGLNVWMFYKRTKRLLCNHYSTYYLNLWKKKLPAFTPLPCVLEEYKSMHSMEWLTSNNTCWKKRQDANMLSDIVRREAMSQNGFKLSKPDAKLPYFWDIITVGSRTAAPAKVTSTIWAIHVVAATILK